MLLESNDHIDGFFGQVTKRETYNFEMIVSGERDKQCIQINDKYAAQLGAHVFNLEAYFTQQPACLIGLELLQI